MRLIAATAVQLKQGSTFDQTPVPSGSQQFKYERPDRPARVDKDTLDQQYFAGLHWDSLLNVMEASYSTMGSFIAEHNQYLSYGNLVEYLNPALVMTMANKEDNPTYKKAMCGPDKAGFIAAMGKEMMTLMELNVYDLVDTTPDKKIIPGVWALKRKQYPDGLLKQLKARFCARGFE